MRIFYAPDGAPEGAAPAPDPTPAPAPEPSGSDLPGFASYMKRESREKHAEALKGYKDKKLDDVFDELVDSKGKLSRAIVIPDPKTATPEDMAAFKKTMGIPDSPDAYDLKTDAFKDMEGVDGLAKEFKLRAASWGLTKGQAAQAFEFLAGIGKSGLEAQAKAKGDHKASFGDRLLEAVGKDQKKADEVMNRVRAFMVKQIADPDLIKDFDASGLLYSPKLAVKLAEISAKLDDAPYIDGKPAPANPAQQGGMGYSASFLETYGRKA